MFFSILSVSAAPVYDSENCRWIYDALESLCCKGLLEGYPDGIFKGDRPLTRYEMAMAVARIIAKLEQTGISIPAELDMSVYATEEDLEILNNLIKEFSSELNGLGIRINNMEDKLADLNLKVKELERIKVSGTMNITAVSIGYSPSKDNTKSFGNPFPAPLTPGPAIIFDRDRYNGPNGGSILVTGSTIMTRLDLTVSGKISDTIKAGADFIAYSAFGEQGVTDEWGLVPPYNSLGQVSGLFNFDSHMGTIWFDTDGDFDLTGKFGEYNLKNVSKNLFSGIRSSFAYGGRDVLPLNGLDISGNLYKTLDFEVFMAYNLNTFKAGDTTGIPQQFRYILATPYNDGVGCYRTSKYGQIDPGQYDNFMYGFWTGYDFNGKRGHIEGAILRLYEDYITNPALGIDENLTAPPKETIYYGLKASYNLAREKVKFYGEFNRTFFDYNLLDNRDGYGGTFINGGASFKLVPFTFYSKYFRIDPNYDPFGYHQHWGRLYQDGKEHHDGWQWTYGSFSSNGRRFSTTRPNRTGIDLGINWKFGNNYNGTLYGNFTYFSQVKPTFITDSVDSFQKYDLLTGIPVSDFTGINIYGNQDHMFTVSDPAKGKEYAFEAGGKYRFGQLNTWGYFEYHNFTRDYETLNYEMDLNYYFANYGLTWYTTRNLSLQGYINYVRATGLNERGKDIKWDQIIPGMGIRYRFSENTEFLLDYKFYTYSSDFSDDVYDKLPDINNDYNGNKLMTRLIVKF